MNPLLIAWLTLVASRSCWLHTPYATHNGLARLDLTTAKSNVKAQALYASLGWQQDEVFYAYSKAFK